jgi:hypothetical protein
MVTARSSLACSSILTVTATPGSSSLYIYMYCWLHAGVPRP